jgi:hypothetical protein
LEGFDLSKHDVVQQVLSLGTCSTSSQTTMEATIR